MPEITLPSSIKKIEVNAFNSSNFTINILSTELNCEKGAFDCCDSIVNVKNNDVKQAILNSLEFGAGSNFVINIVE